jgi:hypothetical protein
VADAQNRHSGLRVRHVYTDKHSGEAFPGVETIAEGVHCSRESVSRSTARQKAVGLLEKEPRRTGRSGWPGTLYTVVAQPIGGAGICDETVTHVCAKQSPSM